MYFYIYLKLYILLYTYICIVYICTYVNDYIGFIEQCPGTAQRFKEQII